MKATLQKSRIDPGVIMMADMKVGQLGVVQGHAYDGEIVMRTLNEDSLEVMSLTKARSGRYWNRILKDSPGPQIPVRLLEKGDKVTLEV